MRSIPSADYPVEAPAVGDALQLVLAGVFEGEAEPATRSLTVWETRTSDGPPRAATLAPMWTAMPRTAAPSKFHLSRVHARADLDPEVADRCTDRLSTPDRTGRTVEGREESVAGGIHVAASVTFDLHASPLVVTGEDRTPLGVAHRAELLRRSDDVGEQDGGEHTVEICRRGATPATRRTSSAKDRAVSGVHESPGISSDSAPGISDAT